MRVYEVHEAETVPVAAPAEVQELVRRSRAKQGLPPHVKDPDVLRAALAVFEAITHP